MNQTTIVPLEGEKVYFIGIGGIWVSALARYYLSEGYEVSGSDSTDSALVQSLISEWCDIIVWSDAERITQDMDLIIYSEAVPASQDELSKAWELWVKTLKYNDALWEVVNWYKLIAVTGTHGKSTTTSMISQILKNSDEDFKSIVWTLLKEFDGKNFYSRWTTGYFAIEACEYKEHFLAYKPTLAVITNIEYDHADYFKTPEDYITAYIKFIDNILPWGFCIIDSHDINSKSLIWRRDDITYIDIQDVDFPEIIMHVPGEHILFDAKLAYIVSHMIGIDDKTILETLEDYSGVWRRMEQIWTTQEGNLLMSDYAHHPTEILTTLSALKLWYPNKKIFVVFQPHQYSRTIELLDWFETCFTDANSLIIPDIYESRDSDEDKAKMSSKIFVEALHHQNKIDWEWLENTLKLIKKYDSENPDSSIILLLWAWNIDNLRYDIDTK